jgi:hypothetical protein
MHYARHTNPATFIIEYMSLTCKLVHYAIEASSSFNWHAVEPNDGAVYDATAAGTWTDVQRISKPNTRHHLSVILPVYNIYNVCHVGLKNRFPIKFI